MKILISNDDGIFAPGIAALVAAFAAAGHEIYVCAPDSQRSAASHSLTIARAISVKEVDFPGAACAYAIGGTPVDCVKLGLTVLCKEAEAVISGVNRGFNAGTDILYSGTVGAAMEGAICGRMSMAVSQHEKREEFESAAQLAVSVFEKMLTMEQKPLTVVNVNYPQSGKAKGLVTASMDQLHYDEIYTPGVNDAGETVYTLTGHVRDDIKQSDDYEKLQNGYATVTVLRHDMTDYSMTNGWNCLV